MKVIHFSSIFVVVLFLLSSCAKPLADFTVQSPNGKLAPAKIVFENKSSKANSYIWDFGDGKTSSEAMPQHRYMGSGTYTIQLKAIKGKKVSISEQKISIDAPSQCLVELETIFGIMTIELDNATPLHRDNFLKLAEQGYYNDLLFHRVINGFMIQGGDPSSKDAAAGQALGMGGPDYTVPAEFVDSLIHIKGALCAARLGDGGNPTKRSSGSQFYIVHGRIADDRTLDYAEAAKGFRYTKEQRNAYKTLGGTAQLDREYTVFGRVIKGLEVIDDIAGTETERGDRPKKDVKMKITVIK